MGDVGGLLETVQHMQSSTGVDTEAMVKRMLHERRFTLGDFREQLKMIVGMGPMGRVMSMIPGMGPMLDALSSGSGGNNEDPTRDLRNMLHILDSMARKELASDGTFKLTIPSLMAPFLG